MQFQVLARLIHTTLASKVQKLRHAIKITIGVILNLRSRCKRKAWGVSPRTNRSLTFQARETGDST